MAEKISNWKIVREIVDKLDVRMITLTRVQSTGKPKLQRLVKNQIKNKSTTTKRK